MAPLSPASSQESKGMVKGWANFLFARHAVPQPGQEGVRAARLAGAGQGLAEKLKDF